MKIQELKITNYRAYSENSQTVKFKPNLNILVGENNVGKSAILRSIEILAGTKSVDKKDYHKTETRREIRIEAILNLDKSEIDSFIATSLKHKDYKKIAKLREIFKDVRCSFSSRDGFFVEFDGLRFFDGIVTLNKRRPKATEGSLQWEKLLDQYFLSEEPQVFSKIIRDFLEERKTKASSIDKKFPNLFQSLLRDRFHIFAEIRQNPLGENVDVLESYDGRQVADVLFKLKNGNASQRRRWRLIKESFHDFFPDLALEVVREKRDSAPEISIEKPRIEFEVPIRNVGAGIGELIILITHLIASRGNLFGLEMPELHFHPHSQRLLKKSLEHYSFYNQFIVTTHSPIFIDENNLESLILIKDVRDTTSVLQIPKEFLNPIEKFRMARKLDVYRKELFFSRKVLLVEGETELGAFPIFSTYLKSDFDKRGISVITSGKHFALFAKLLRIYKIPFLVVADSDALMQIYKAVEFSSGKKTIKVKTSTVFFNLWKADMTKKKDLNFLKGLESQIENEKYPEKILPELRKICRDYNVYVLSSDFENVLASDDEIRTIYDQARKFSNSKVVRGRFVAEKIKRQKLKLPKEFSEVIQKIIRMRG